MTSNAPAIVPGRVRLTVLCVVAAAAVGTLAAFAPVIAAGLVLLAAAIVVLVRSQPLAMSVTAVVLLYSNAPVLLAEQVGIPTTLAHLTVPGLLAMAAWSRTVIEHRPLALPRPFPWLLLYLSSLVVSTALSPFPGLAASEMLVFLTEGLLLYVLVVNAVRDTQTLRACIWAMVLTAVALASLSIVQTATSTYANDYLGFAQHSLEDVTDFLNDPENGPARVGGPIGAKNRYAQILMMVLFVPVMTAIRHPGRHVRFAALGMSVLIMAGVALTFSRGAFVALAVLVLAMLVIRELPPRAVVALALGVVVLAVALPSGVQRLASAAPILEGADAVDDVDGAVRGRLSSNLGALRVFMDHPVVGVGPGTYPRLHKSVVEDLGLRVVPNREVHNLYLHILAETGLIGAAMFAGLLITTLRGLWWVRRRHPPGTTMSLLSTGMFLGVLAYLSAGIFLHLSFARYFWLLMALAAAVAAIEEDVTAA